MAALVSIPAYAERMLRSVRSISYPDLLNSDDPRCRYRYRVFRLGWQVREERIGVFGAVDYKRTEDV